MICFDTNAIIYYLQNDRNAVSVIDVLRKKDEHFVISTITEMEVLSFPKLGVIEQLQIGVWLNEFSIVPVDSTIAREAARIRREYGLKSPDAIIAATAMFYGASLVTRDKNFDKISELKVVGC